MMIFAYALYVPAGIALTSAYAAQLLAGTVGWAVPPWVLYLAILAAVVLVAYLGASTSSCVDLVLVAGEVAVISALAITVLVKVGPAHYSAAVLSPAASPHGQFTDLTQAMIYGITAFAGFEAAAALGEEAGHSRRSIPAATFGVVAMTGIFFHRLCSWSRGGTRAAASRVLARDRVTLTALPPRMLSRVLRYQEAVAAVAGRH